MSGLGKQVFVQLEALESHERASFLKHIEMFTTNPTSIKLAELVMEKAIKQDGEYQGPKGEALGPWLWREMGKKGDFQTRTLSTDFNRLKKGLDSYFAYLGLEDDDVVTQMVALRAYRRRNVAQLSRGHIAALKKETQTVDFWNLLRRVELYLLEAEHLAQGLKRKRNGTIDQFLGALDHAGKSLMQLEKLGEAMLETVREHYEFMFNEHLQYDPAGGSKQSQLIAQIYKDLTQVIRKFKGYRSDGFTRGEAELERLVNIANSLNQANLSPFHGRDLYGRVIALSAPLINHGVEGASKEAFEILRIALEKGFMADEGKMDAKTFKVILESAVEQEALEFAEDFVATYGVAGKISLTDSQQKTDHNSIKALIDYAWARIYLLQGEYQKARKLAAKGGLKDSLFVLSQRWLEILAAYRLACEGEEEWLKIEDMLNAFSRSLGARVKKDVHYQAALYQQRIPYFLRLVRAWEEMNPARKRSMLQDLQIDLKDKFQTKGGRTLLKLAVEAMGELVG